MFVNQHASFLIWIKCYFSQAQLISGCKNHKYHHLKVSGLNWTGLGGAEANSFFANSKVIFLLLQWIIWSNDKRLIMSVIT